MTTWNPQLARLRQELARIALAPETVHERAAATLAALGRVLPYDAAWLAVRDSERRRYTPLATAGAAEALREYFQTSEADLEAEQLGLNRPRPPMLTSDLPGPLTERRLWAEYLLPAGLRGGLAAGLFTPAGRHVGLLKLLSEDPSRPGPADREVVAAVTAVVAHGLDRTWEIAATARIVEAAHAGVVLTRDGNTLPLPGLPDHQLLAPGSAILAAAAEELAHGAAAISFLAPTGALEEGDLVRVSALDSARPGLDHLRAAVLLSPPGDLRGLTVLDLRLLGLLVEGAPSIPAIAVPLGVGESTVADSLRAVLTALDAPNPTAVTVRALRTGLRIPPRLGTPG